jgi:hypothetical protein
VGYPETRTFWIEPTETVAVALRRFTFSDPAKHDQGLSGCERGYHTRSAYIGTAAARWKDTDHGRVLDSQPDVPHGDGRWPETCRCGHRFGDGDQWQVFQSLLYRRPDSDAVYMLHDYAPGEVVPVGEVLGVVAAPAAAPPGASWDAWWYPDSDAWRGPDGIAFTVRLPNGQDWFVDGQASNCTRKGEPHKCWIRRGDPRRGDVTVDKAGDTCAAGAGSIQAGDYHGFLRAGVLTAG